MPSITWSLIKYTLLISLALQGFFVLAQDEAIPEDPVNPSIVTPTWDVYLQRNADGRGTDRLLFVDVLMDETTQYDVVGERYTVIGSKVIFFDYVAQRVMSVVPGEAPVPHPAIQLDDGARRIDWVVSPDKRLIAWVITYGQSEALTTVTRMSTPSGANLREVFRDGPRNGIRALPVSFTYDGTGLIMDAHPDGLSRFVAFSQYAGLFRVDLETGEIATLPGEPACFCGGAVRAGRFVRLTLMSDLSGYDLMLYDLEGDRQTLIPGLRLSNYPLAGDVLISPDGTLAVYVLSRIENFGTPGQRVESVFVLADLLAMTQRTLLGPISSYVRPVRWTDDNSAILATNPQQDGTWKIMLADTRLEQVARSTFIGSLQAD